MLHENIVIGGSLEALKFAYDNDYPILCIPQKPHFFRPKCLAEWEHLAFLLSLSGNMPMSSNISSIRIDEEQKEIKNLPKYGFRWVSPDAHPRHLRRVVAAPRTLSQFRSAEFYRANSRARWRGGERKRT